jgi:GT2 family glycosyltransferase
MRDRQSILVSIVTFNDARWIDACLESVFAQSVGGRVKVFDNGSSDSSPDLASRFPVTMTRCLENLGFSRAHNLNIEGEDAEAVLFLNPDVRLDPRFLENAITALEQIPQAGMVAGKLGRSDEGGAPLFREGLPVLDSAGMYFTPAQRHLDRGSQELDRGQYERRQLVFGGTGAALVCSGPLVKDLRQGGELFDEDFFIYREDADLAWRAQLRGWDVVYEPAAKAWHHRSVLPSNRRRTSPLINYHSLKNRFLMRLKNMDDAVRRRCFPYMWLRDAAIFGYALTLERSSVRAYADVRRLRPKFLEKRRIVQSERKVGPQEIAKWFSFRPVSFEV